ncbi:MAG: Crp/Fnr family transcriptional regulator [Anaerolineae bacterium]|nr:Crp/Fnr family transcriptional regulator [Anaerolineae bacterium]
MLKQSNAPEYGQLHTAVSQWVDLSATQWQQFAAIFRPRLSEKGQYVALPGDNTHQIIFVIAGLLRFYYVDEEGQETNKAFVGENEFAGPLASAVLGLPLYFGIQALEATRLLMAPYTAYAHLFDQDLVFERLGRKLTETLLVRKEVRTRSLLQQNATERYLGFLEMYPHLVNRIPQYHLASYLGISEVSLSRLKNSSAAR